MANNRRGVSARTQFALGPLRFSVGAETERDILARSELRAFRELRDAGREGEIPAFLTFPHPLASEIRSEFEPFSTSAGPYDRLVNFFRFTQEQVPVTGPARLAPKAYNSLEAQVKNRLTLFGRDFIQTYFGTYHSVQDGVRAAPDFTSGAYLRAQYHELGLYYLVHPRLAVLAQAGVERNRTNRFASPLDADGTPREIDQTGTVLGFGVDYDFADRVGLYGRVRRFEHHDDHFALDFFEGWQATLELKAFF
jgi:hypothetical protein